MNATLDEAAKPAKVRIGLEAFTVGSFTMAVRVVPQDEENEDFDLILAQQHEHAMRQMAGFCF